ncbi:MAG: hypothetical protein HY282_10685 [Nitrospirae bacterium]|nr:hypothetical protein [Candidatus Manganitrophaceae bacterium]
MKGIAGLTAAILLGGVFGLSVVAAEEKVVQATSPWQARGYAFPVSDDEVYLVSVFTGTMFVTNDRGALNSLSIVCPGTMNGNLKTNTKSGQGRCILSDVDGDRVYAHFTCTGDPQSCRGPFELNGGTGKFIGITGRGEMISQMQVHQTGTVAGYETSQLLSEGVAVWPKLTYNIPAK